MWIRSQDKEKLINVNDLFEIEKVELKPVYASDKKECIIEWFTEEKLEEFKTENDVEVLKVKTWIRGNIPGLESKEAKIIYREIKRQYKYNIITSKYILGTYATKEKALKVLDDIQAAIIYMEEAVVVMPQDEEVEECKKD